jgi:hypothetical protein
LNFFSAVPVLDAKYRLHVESNAESYSYTGKRDKRLQSYSIDSGI